MKPNRLASATIATFLLGAPALASAQLPPGEGEGEGTTTEGEPVIPEEPPPLPAADDHAIHVSYDKGLVFETVDESYELKLGVRSQFRLETVRRNVAEPVEPELETRFSVPRLRLQLEGHALGKANGYKVEFDMANKGFALLKDFFVDHAFSKTLHLRAGQWKRPFNRQELVSDFGSEFLERSIANEFSGAGRDLGVALHNDYEKSPDGVEWALGVFNATGEKAATGCKPGATPTDPPTCSVPTNVPVDFGPAIVAHVGFNSGKIKGYSEGDLEGGPLRFAVGASYKLNPRDLDKDADDNLLLHHAVALDAMVKVEGLGVTGALVLIKDGQADLAMGFYGQAGYMLMPKKLLGSVRFAQIPEGDEKKMEILGGVNWLWKGHSFKWMLDGGVIRTTGDASKSDLQIRTQVQFVL